MVASDCCLYLSIAFEFCCTVGVFVAAFGFGLVYRLHYLQLLGSLVAAVSGNCLFTAYAVIDF